MRADGACNFEHSSFWLPLSCVSLVATIVGPPIIWPPLAVICNNLICMPIGPASWIFIHTWPKVGGHGKRDASDKRDSWLSSVWKQVATTGQWANN